jgi:hypothetical protein
MQAALDGRDGDIRDVVVQQLPIINVQALDHVAMLP